MTTKDSKGFFPSCDPLFATLTAAVLERDIVIVQAEAELYASVSTNFTITGLSFCKMVPFLINIARITNAVQCHN